MNALLKAFADSERSYCSAKASIASNVSALLAQSSVGGIGQSIELAHGRSLERHFTGWVYSAVEGNGRSVLQGNLSALGSRAGVPQVARKL